MSTVAYAPRPSEGGHWYTRAGAAHYEIIGKTTGRPRPVRLDDAKALGLVPSVSAILQMEAKPALVNWMVDQALMAAITLPRIAGEHDDDFIKRAKEDSQAQAKKARDRGTSIHAAVQGYFEGQSTSGLDLPYVMPVTDWLSQRFGLAEWHPEKSFAHVLGYGGKADLVSFSRPAVIDFKTKDFGPEKQAKDLAYGEHCSQLGGYARGFGFDIRHCDCANVFISTRVPGLIRVREWDTAELVEGLEVFDLLLRLWKIRKNFDPSFQEKAA